MTYKPFKFPYRTKWFQTKNIFINGWRIIFKNNIRFIFSTQEMVIKTVIGESQLKGHINKTNLVLQKLHKFGKIIVYLSNLNLLYLSTHIILEIGVIRQKKWTVDSILVYMHVAKDVKLLNIFKVVCYLSAYIAKIILMTNLNYYNTNKRQYFS